MTYCVAHSTTSTGRAVGGLGAFPRLVSLEVSLTWTCGWGVRQRLPLYVYTAVGVTLIAGALIVVLFRPAALA
jgi:hypothetical protein